MELSEEVPSHESCDDSGEQDGVVAQHSEKSMTSSLVEEYDAENAANDDSGDDDDVQGNEWQGPEVYFHRKSVTHLGGTAMMGSRQFQRGSWKKDIISDIKQHLRGGSSNYPGRSADHPYLQTAHLSCREMDALSEKQFISDNEVARRREDHLRELARNSECLGVKTQR